MKKIGISLFVLAFAVFAVPIGSVHVVASSTPIHFADGGYPPPPPCPITGCQSQNAVPASALSVTPLVADGGYPPPPPCPLTGCQSQYAPSELLGLPAIPVTVRPLTTVADGGYPPPPPCPLTGCDAAYVA